MTAQHLTSTRINNLDAIRGLALLGILFLNIYYFASPVYGYSEAVPASNIDVWLGYFSDLFLEGRFISLFSLLFGVGLLIQQENFNARRLDGLAQSKRRLKWLLLFGAIHGIFIWGGDILFTYGISGWFALNYHQLTADKLLKKACQFILIGTIATCVMLLISGPEEPILRNSKSFLEEHHIWTSSYAEQVFIQFFYFCVMAIAIPFSLLFYISGLMLLGMALYKKQVFTQGLSHNLCLKLALGSLLCFGFNLYIGHYHSLYQESLGSTFTLIGGLFMGLIYLNIIVKLCNNQATKLTWLQKIGRMAFSLYILQSVIGIALFRYLYPSWGLDFDRSDYLLLAVAISILQIVIANVYFKLFNQGPLEKLWRSLTYSKMYHLPRPKTYETESEITQV